MRYLLDTCTFLWYVTDDPQLSKTARELIREPENDVYLSSASAWEVAIKYAMGNLQLPEIPKTYVAKLRRRHNIDTLPIAEEECLQSSLLPSLHRDPFDRILIAQAIVHQLTILTPDILIQRYPVRVHW